MALVASLRQVKGEYAEAFLMTGDDRSVIRVCPTPLEYWVSTSDASDLNALRDEERANPGKSPFEYIKALAERHPEGMSRSNQSSEEAK